ncbi:MAG: LURP-one-related family protein [Bacilli bacterium]|nr:LURP-one-related family protein [Bacilli bacterium]
MKKFYINEKLISIGDRYKIFNQDGSIAYEVKERLFTFGKQFALYNTGGQRLAYIKQKLFRFLPRYNIYIDNQHVATVKKKFTFFVSKYDILSSHGNYVLDGDFLAWNFSISKDGNVFCSVSKNFNLFRDKYEVAIADGFSEILSLCYVIVLDAVHHSKKSRR